jgi:acyl-CoA synthetase (AMP-forming)/AMP-acid ligase II
MTRNPGKVAIRFSGAEITYGSLVDRYERLASTILEFGAGSQDWHAGIIARNCPEFIEIVAASALAGAPLATINPRLTRAEIEAICDDAKVELLFADPAGAAAIAGASFRTVRRVIVLGEQYESLIAGAQPVSEPPLVDEWSTFTIPYTSGTTGRPKGVLVPHRSRILNWFALASEYGCYSPDDRFLAVSPMCFGAGLSFALASIFLGGTLEIMDRFDPENLLCLFCEERITGVFLVPTHFHGIFELPAPVLDKYRGRFSLKAIMSNAAPLSQTMKKKIVAYFGGGLLHELYGSTEAAIVTNLRPEDQLRKPRCVGTPFVASSVRILDADGLDCGAGEIGELFSQSPFLFNGYWNRPEETEAAFRNGWVTVGDLAVRDDEGYIYIVDRKKDMVISGGVNIYPREIEEVLLQHPGIAEVAVVGLPDEKWGERLKAFIVPRGGQTIDMKEITAFTAGKLPSFKVPQDCEILDEMPRNANGKVLKTILRQRTGAAAS